MRIAAAQMQEPPACCKLPHLHPPLIISHLAKLQTFELIEGTAVTQPAQCKNLSWVRAAATLMQEPASLHVRAACASELHAYPCRKIQTFELAVSEPHG